MKKKLFLLAISILLTCTYANAQVLIGLLFGDKLNSPRTEFGLNLNLNHCNISDISNPEYKRALGFGLFFDFKITDNWVFGSSLFFLSPKGVENFNKSESFYGYFADSSFIDATTTRKMNYFEIPLFMKYQLKSGFGLAAGFNVGLQTSSSDIIINSVYEGTSGYKADVKDNFNLFHLEAMAGLHYHFRGDPGAQIRLNYLYGLTNVYKDESGREGFSRIIQIGVTIPMKFGVTSAVNEKE